MRIRRALLALLSTIVVLASLLVAAPPAEAEYWDEDGQRLIGVTQSIKAFEQFGITNSHYTPVGAGFNGQGRGWFNKDSGAGYANSISSELVGGGYLAAGEWHHGAGSAVGDFAIYQCADRVAVFSQSDGMAPSATDAQWWTNNGCNPYAINTLGLTYFQVSNPLGATCNGFAATPTTINAAGEIVGTAGDDVIVGTNGDDVIRGFGGNDIICGLGGDDWIQGDSGNDIILPGPGADNVRGGTGNDWAAATAAEALDDDLRGGSGEDWVVDSFVPGTTDPAACLPCFPNRRLM